MVDFVGVVVAVFVVSVDVAVVVAVAAGGLKVVVCLVVEYKKAFFD